MSLAISKKDGNEIWAGTDDGLIHLTRNGGKEWTNITPKGLKPGIINSIDLSEFLWFQTFLDQLEIFDHLQQNFCSNYF
mgnify:CR=1 FL=1